MRPLRIVLQLAALGRVLVAALVALALSVLGVATVIGLAAAEGRQARRR